MKRIIAAVVLSVAAIATLIGVAAGTADAGPKRTPVQWSPATAAAQIAWQKGLPLVERWQGHGRYAGHRGCWAAIGRTSYIVCRDGFRTDT